MMIKTGTLLVLLCSRMLGQDFVVRGLTAYALDREDTFPVIVRDSSGHASPTGQYITIQFDVQGKEPPPLKIRFFHCNRDWVPEQNLFVQDESHNTSFILDYVTSPNGNYHTVALKQDDTVWAWGRNSYGQLGNGTTTDSSTPVQVLSGVKAIATGYYHTVAVKQDGTVWTWGWNANGQLGNGTQTDSIRKIWRNNFFT